MPVGKTIAVALRAASLLVLVGMVGANFPTKEVVSQMIAQESPYVQDRKLILYRLDQIKEQLDEVLDNQK